MNRFLEFLPERVVARPLGVLSVGMVALLFSASALAEGVLLYDVDFGTPPHTVGLPPLVGAGDPPRATPTSVNFGDPTVVAAVGLLVDQPCAFGNGTAGYDQLEFGVGTSHGSGFSEDYDDYDIEVYVLVEERPGSGPRTAYLAFSVLADVPSTKRLDFYSDGVVVALTAAGEPDTVGFFVVGVPVSVEIHLDIPHDEWTISLDGVEVHTGTVGATELRSVRLHQSGFYLDESAAADGFRVYGSFSASVHGDETSSGSGAGFHLEQNTPNPFNPETAIAYAVPVEGRVSLTVYDPSGRLVRRLVGSSHPAGTYSAIWDGRDDAGLPVSSGTYFCRLEAAGCTETRKMVLLK